MEKSVIRRLLLAKEFHLNACELAKKKDPLSRMMAVHNFHIGIEITLKAIFLKYEIRKEKELTISFEALFNEIDKHEDFKKQNLQLPLRLEIRGLNSARNLVQHQAMEPDPSSLDDWRLYSHSFLSQVFERYFQTKFEEVSRIYYIEDVDLKSYLNRSVVFMSNQEYSSAIFLASAAFKYASISLHDFLPYPTISSHVARVLKRSPQLSDAYLQEAFFRTHERIDEIELFYLLLSSGITITNYRKFQATSPQIHLLATGQPHDNQFSNEETSQNQAEWTLDFVINSIILWQQSGLNPKVQDHHRDGARTYLASQ